MLHRRIKGSTLESLSHGFISHQFDLRNDFLSMFDPVTWPDSPNRQTLASSRKTWLMEISLRRVLFNLDDQAKYVSWLLKVWRSSNGGRSAMVANVRTPPLFRGWCDHFLKRGLQRLELHSRTLDSLRGTWGGGNLPAVVEYTRRGANRGNVIVAFSSWSCVSWNFLNRITKK